MGPKRVTVKLRVMAMTGYFPRHILALEHPYQMLFTIMPRRPSFMSLNHLQGIQRILCPTNRSNQNTFNTDYFAITQ